MRRALVDPALMITTFTIQSFIFPLLPFLSTAPNLLLILMSFFGFMEGGRTGMVYGVVAGLLLDLFYSRPFGPHALFYVYVGYINGICTEHYYEDYTTLPLILCFFSKLAYDLYMYILRFLIRGRLNSLYCFQKLMTPEITFTVVITLFVYRLLLRINR